jgi:tyrosinase
MMSNSVLGTYNSLENIHNGIHTWVGGTGHMALIPWSSYDPIFWIHHAYVMISEAS